MIGYGINALSPKIAGKLQVGMTVIKLIPLILMGVAGTIAGLVNGTTLEVLDYVNSADYVAVDGTGFSRRSSDLPSPTRDGYSQRASTPSLRIQRRTCLAHWSSARW